MCRTEDRLFEVFEVIEANGLRSKFDLQLKKMKDQDKHKYKSVAEKWEYALYRVQGGESREKY